MALFPAYSVDETQPKVPEASLSWLSNASCPPEVGQQPPPQSTSSEDASKSPPSDEATEALHQTDSASLSTRRKKKKKKKSDSTRGSEPSSDEGRALERKPEREEREDPSQSVSQPPTPEKCTKNPSELRSSVGRQSRSQSKSLGSRSSSESRSGSEDRGKKSKRKEGKAKTRRSKKRKSRSRSRSKTRSKKRKFRSRSRSRKRSRSRSRKRSRSRSRKKSRSRSRKRSRSRSRKKSRSWSRKRSRSRSRKRSRSRSRKRSRSRSRKRSRSRSRKRSRSRSRKRSRSRSRKGKSQSKSREYSGSKSQRNKDREQRTFLSSEKLVSSNKSVFLEDLHGVVKPEVAFFLSTDGDANNRVFTTTHFSQLASYKINAKGELGTSRQKGSRKKSLRYFRKNALKMLYSDPITVMLPLKDSSGTSPGVPEESYIPLSLTYEEEVKARKTQASAVNPLGIYDNTTEQYLSGVGGLPKEEESIETYQDAEYEMWQRKSKLYNERLGKEPHNVSLWLEFVKFQDDSYKVLYQGSEPGNKDTTTKKHKVTRKALAERKISILDSAIKKNIRSLDLYLERLEIGKDLWEDKKLKQEWDTLVFNFPNKISVWHRYLMNMQTHFTSFTLSSVVKTFAKCTERLQQIRAGIFLTHAAPPELGKCLVDVAVQLAHVLRQGGHMERSVALFQALVELNIFPPKHIDNKDIQLDAKLALFEPFWDSRAPRFGEEKAVGWAQVMEKRKKIEYPEVILEGTVDEEDEIIAQGGTTSQLWLALETSRERKHWLPWEQDPEDCEDPERMVPLEELSPHLFILDCTEDKFYLVLQFIKFLGIPDIDNYLQESKHPKSTAKARNIFQPLVIETLFDANLFGNHLSMGGSCTTKGILNFDAVGPSVFASSCDDYYQFLCRVVQQAAGAFELSHKKHLTLLHIKLLATHYQVKKKEVGDESRLKSLGKEIKKQIKNVLKSEEFRMCIPVYQEYGKAEEAMGHFAEAENVFVTALTIGTADGKALDINNDSFQAVMDLYLSYIHLQMDREAEVCSGQHSNNILGSLCSLFVDGKFSVPNGSPVSGGNLIKTKKILHQLQELSGPTENDICSSETKRNNEFLTVKAVTFLALIQLLTIGFAPGCLVFESIIDKINLRKDPEPHKLEDISLPTEKMPKPKTQNTQDTKIKNECAKVLECMYEDYLWFIEASSRLGHLVKDGKMSPVCKRSIITSALKVAPDNRRFLLLLAQNQSWYSLLSGMKSFSHRSVSIVALVSQLLPHIQKTITLIANTDDGSLSCGHRLESVLEQGVSQPPGSNCPLLWRLYLTLVATTRPKGLKDLIYRALVQCPGVKSVYLDCVRLVPGMLKELVKLLTEKGMRVRLPLEELQVLTEAELEFEEENEASSCEEETETAIVD